MNRDSVATLLVGLLFLSALVAVWASVRWFFSVRELQSLQVNAAQVNNTRAAAQALANDALMYSRKNPAMDALLQEFNVRQKGETGTNQPGPKPAAK